MVNFNNLNLIEKGVLGLAIGDALGVPYEFKERNTFKCIGYDIGGVHNVLPGTWSDDTSMALCTLENIYEKGHFSDLMKKFINFRDNGYMTPDEECFDIGMTVNSALDNFKHLNKLPEKCGLNLESSLGNGSLMRILPCLALLNDNMLAPEVFDVAREYSCLTHRHPFAIEICEKYLYILYLASLPNTNKEFFKTYLKYLSGSQRFNKEYISFNWFIKTNSESKSSGYVMDTFNAALYAFMTTDNFKDCVFKAVNLGGDSDTTGAVAGGLAAIFYKNIPQDLIEGLRGKEVLQNVFEKRK